MRRASGPGIGVFITLAELFQGRKPDIPYVDASAAFKRAVWEDGGRQEQLL